VSTDYPSSKKRGLHIIVSYLLSAFTGALGILNWMMLRETVITVITHSSINKWSWRAIDNFSFVLFGMIWLTLVLYSQHYYLKGANQGRLWRNFSLITGIQALLLFVCHMTSRLIGAASSNSLQLFILAMECIIGIAFIVLSRTAARKSEKLTH
jgi:hypothetical protein